MESTGDATWDKLETRWDEGFDTLTSEEQEAIALWWLEAETMNGTLDQFFWNNAGDMAMIALAGLKSLGMTTTRQAFESALAFFGDDYPLDRSERMRRLEALEEAHGTKIFLPATRIIQDLPEDFVQAALDRLEKIYADA